MVVLGTTWWFLEFREVSCIIQITAIFPKRVHTGLSGDAQVETGISENSSFYSGKKGRKVGGKRYEARSRRRSSPDTLDF